MATGDFTMKVKMVGIKEAIKQVKSLKKEVDTFYSTGRKYGLSQKSLSKLFTYQVDNLDKPKLDISQLVNKIDGKGN